MLKTRVLTAAVIAVAAFAIVFLLPGWGFRAAIAGLLMVGCWEYGRLAALGNPARALLMSVQVALFAWLFHAWPLIAGHGAAFLTAACLCWLLMLLRLSSWRPGTAPGLHYRLLSTASAVASLTFAAYALFWLHGRAGGEWLVLMLLFIIWAADVGAYFAGRRFGRHRLAPRISPGKTREGLAGGLVLAIIVALALEALTGALPAAPGRIMLLTAVTVLVSAGGDLFISLHKRTVGVKDAGRLFPGHGGVLDRFDSLLAGAPFFALGVLLTAGQP